MTSDPLDDLASLDQVDHRSAIDWKQRVRLFAIINFVLALAMGVENFFQVIDVGKVVNSLGVSNISSDDFYVRVAWSLRGILAVVVYLGAGVCLFKEWRWGYHLHMIACVMTTVLGTPMCCVFIPWTIWGLNWAGQEGFRAVLNQKREDVFEEPFVD